MDKLKSKYKGISRSDFISGIALGISVISFGFYVFQFRWENREKVIVASVGLANDRTVVSPAFISDPFGSYTENVRIRISNNSNRDVSIVDCGGWFINYGKKYNISSMFNIFDKKDFDFPINIPPHNTIYRDITIQWNLNPYSASVLSENYNDVTEQKLITFFEHMYKNGIDQFGNSVKYNKYETGFYNLSFNGNRYLPIIKLELISSEESVFSASIKPQ